MPSPNLITDAEKVRHSPCSYCTRKSVARIRCYANSFESFHLICFCHDHLSNARPFLISNN